MYVYVCAYLSSCNLVSSEVNILCILSILVCTSFECVCMHCNESINVAINSQSYNNHSHVHMNTSTSTSTHMSRLICNAAAPSLNAAVVVCVCVRWAHTQHTHLYQLLHLLCLFVSNSLINKFSKTKNVQRLSVRIWRRQLHVLCVKSA